MRAFPLVVACLLGATLVTVSPGHPAWSHAALVKSFPANGASLKQAPSVIRAWFSEELGLPPLRLLAPTNKAQVKNPVALLIETPGDISQLTMGNSMGSMSGMGPRVHLHITVDGATFMPSASQLTKVGPSRYEYRLPMLASGTHTIKVYWADNKTHAPAGAVQTVTCSVVGG